ncbi:MAG: methionine--tRNA ligase [Sphingomonadaceae bacterium]|nr:methionine--tRNA ligase [Sphingomonadaceae bacterium]
MSDPFYITTAIAYPNGRPHIGHAYEAIATDAIARWHRLAARDVRFMTGTDEHGLKMAQKARDLGTTPRALSDEMSSYFRDMDDALGISYDRFIRTTEPDHYRASQALWAAMKARGDIYLGRYEGWYSVRDEAFYGEDELIEGEGGAKLSPQGTPVEWTVEESWFFRLSAYQDKLLELYDREPDFVRPETRRNEVASFVRGGLSDLSISRTSFDWGVPVPDSPGPNDQKHVMYVWVDALTNYLTGLGYPDKTADYERYWPANVHVIGKDIVRFHAVYWPAFLMSAGLPLPKQVFAHGFLLNRGEKMSKSVGNVVDPIEMAQLYGVDALRYFLLREVSFGQDGSYSHDAIVTRVNADLANGLGNLAQRCLSMIAKQCGGVVPAKGASHTVIDSAGLLRGISSAMDDLALHRALEILWEGVRDANGFFAEAAPWALRKTDPAAADAILYSTAEAVRQLAILARWAIPSAADALLDQLGQHADARDLAALDRPLAPGTVLPQPQGVFPRLEL